MNRRDLFGALLVPLGMSADKIQAIQDGNGRVFVLTTSPEVTNAVNFSELSERIYEQWEEHFKHLGELVVISAGSTLELLDDSPVCRISESYEERSYEVRGRTPEETKELHRLLFPKMHKKS